MSLREVEGVEVLGRRDRDRGEEDLLSDPGMRDLLEDAEERDLRSDPGIQDLVRDLGVREALRLGIVLTELLPTEARLVDPASRSGGLAVSRSHV